MSMRLRLILIVSAFFALGAYVATLWLVPQPPVLRAMVVPGSKALVGGPFTLTDKTGKRVSDKDFRGRYMLIFFGYTFCPDVCPTGLQTISAALARLGPRAVKMAPIFITLDPERDTPQVLADYLSNFDPRLIGLTGSPEEIAAVAKAYHVYHAKVAETGSPGDYLLDHSAIYFLMDEKGDYAGHFAYGVSPDELARGIARLL